MSNEELKQEIASRLIRLDDITDIWQIFLEARLLRAIIRELSEPWRDKNITKVAGVESRGFIFAPAVAAELGAGFVAIRKPGGIYPGSKYSTMTEPDYSGKSKELLLQKHSLGPSDRVLIVDDWVSTGSQTAGVRDLVEQAGAEYMGLSAVVNNLADEMKAALSPVATIVLETELTPDH